VIGTHANGKQLLLQRRFCNILLPRWKKFISEIHFYSKLYESATQICLNWYNSFWMLKPVQHFIKRCLGIICFARVIMKKKFKKSSAISIWKKHSFQNVENSWISKKLKIFNFDLDFSKILVWNHAFSNAEANRLLKKKYSCTLHLEIDSMRDTNQGC
jgi:hypothetical protein